MACPSVRGDNPRSLAASVLVLTRGNFEVMSDARYFNENSIPPIASGKITGFAICSFLVTYVLLV